MKKKQKMYLILWSWRWREHDSIRYEISQIKNKKIKVIVFEFIDHLYPHFISAYKYSKTPKRVIKIRDLNDLRTRLKILEKKYNIIILNNIDSLNLKGFLINYFLNRKQNNIVLKLKSSQIPVVKKNTSFQLTLENFNKSLKYPMTAYYFIRMYFFSWLEKKFKLFPNFLLRAGLKHYPIYMEKCGVKIKDINSLDYSNYLTHKSNNIKSKKNYILFIDSAGPKFVGDLLLFKGKYPFTSEKWYPSLNAFFTRIEKKLKLKVLIAPHPKTEIKNRPNYLGYRTVSKKKIYDLIDNSKLVITRISTAISYAIVRKKPILFIYSDELNKHKNYMDELNLFVKQTGSKVFNIDNNFEKLDINSLMRINLKKYKKYKMNYITILRKEKPNNLLIKDIFEENFK